jgi:hypothetical protein
MTMPEAESFCFFFQKEALSVLSCLRAAAQPRPARNLFSQREPGKLRPLIRAGAVIKASRATHGRGGAPPLFPPTMRRN